MVNVAADGIVRPNRFGRFRISNVRSQISDLKSTTASLKPETRKEPLMSDRLERRDFLETLGVTAAGGLAAGYSATAKGFAANE